MIFVGGNMTSNRHSTDECHAFQGKGFVPLRQLKQQHMKANVGMTDKLIRYGIAAALVSLQLSGVLTGTLGIIALVASAILLISGMISFCPLYTAFGWNTRNQDASKNLKH